MTGMRRSVSSRLFSTRTQTGCTPRSIIGTPKAARASFGPSATAAIVTPCSLLARARASNPISSSGSGWKPAQPARRKQKSRAPLSGRVAEQVASLVMARQASKALIWLSIRFSPAAAARSGSGR